jgi:UDP-N-acetylmuramoyl-tripeptide--D-alanyl-D-alanine ligase
MVLISEAAKNIGAEWEGEDAEFASVSVDSRSVKPGDLFVALVGAKFNGHDYVNEVFSKGACAALVSEAVASEGPLLKVDDTRSGLGKLAASWKQQYEPRTIAVTGSCGKTTVKEMLASILSQQGGVLATRGNLNNEIGVPLTLLRINDSHDFAVVELGANHKGEIAYTTRLTRPDVAVITNAGAAHLEGFGTEKDVARAKAEIYQGLTTDGVAVINLDDNYAGYWLDVTSGHRQLTFSFDRDEADLFVTDCQVDDRGCYQFTLNAETEQVSIRLGSPGKHNVLNALAAAAVTKAAGCSLEIVKSGLEKFASISGRLEWVLVGNRIRVIDDTYNANPGSLQAAIDLLHELPGKSCLVLGDMSELGTSASALHRQMGSYAAQRGIDELLVIGQYADSYVQGFQGSQGSRNQTVLQFDNHDEVARYLIRSVGPEIRILIKGSRSAGMERVIETMNSLMTASEGKD